MVVYHTWFGPLKRAGKMELKPDYAEGVMAVASKQEFIESRVIPYLYRNHPESMHEIRQDLWGDVWADLGTHILAIHVWGPDSTLSEEAANAIKAASADPDAIPVVAIPAGCADPSDLATFRGRGVLIWELGPPN